MAASHEKDVFERQNSFLTEQGSFIWLLYHKHSKHVFIGRLVMSWWLCFS